MEAKTVIMVPMQYYKPGYRAGGSIRTVSNFIEHFHVDYQFKIITSNVDLGESTAYSSITPNVWLERDGCGIYYAARKSQFFSMVKQLRVSDYHLLYLNSVFSPLYSILPLLLMKAGLVAYCPVIIAPRGECSREALSMKRWKKSLFIAFARRIGLFKHVIWQASSVYERDEISRCMGGGASVTVAHDLPPMGSEEPSLSISKEMGRIKIVFISRIVIMKNLHYALECLSELQGAVQFDIYGPVEDMKYWRGCQSLIEKMPPNIAITYKGAIPNSEVPSVLAKYHLFFLPTLGEGYGHAIQEAFLSGCPVLISDRTPWRNLQEYGVGWSLPLEDQEAFKKALTICLSMDTSSYVQFRNQTIEYARSIVDSAASIDENKKLLQLALGS